MLPRIEKFNEQTKYAVTFILIGLVANCINGTNVRRLLVFAFIYYKHLFNEKKKQMKNLGSRRLYIRIIKLFWYTIQYLKVSHDNERALFTIRFSF